MDIIARHRPSREPNRCSARALVALGCCVFHDCGAVDKIVLEIEHAELPAVRGSQVAVTVDLAAAGDVTAATEPDPTLRLQAKNLQVSNFGGFRDIDIHCADFILKQPHFACARGTLAALGGPSGKISMRAAAAYDSTTGAVSFSGAGLALAGGDTRFAGTLVAGAWSLNVDATAANLAAARTLAAPWVSIPDTESVTGHVNVSVQAAGLSESMQAHVAARSADLSFSNQAGTTVGQNLTASLSGTGRREQGKVTSNLEVRGSAGQALAGPVLLDFAANPLVLQARVETATGLTVRQIHLTQKDLIEATGEALIDFKSNTTLSRAHFDIERLEVPAAYRTLLQIALATTDFGALDARGTASGQVDVADDALTRVNARLDNVSLNDPKTRFSLAAVTGELHWAADAAAAVEPSRLEWSSSSVYGLSGGPVRLSFVGRGKDFALNGDTRFPIFDGALVVHTLAARRLGAANAEVDFDAHLEPISMPLVSKAFGWPTLSGQLAGRIPGVTYRDRVLAVEGDLTANVFDGTIVGSRFKLRDPFGPWPRLDADVRARGLDLDLVTHTFSIGSITGRLDADVKGLELFNWSPIAFDARLQSTPGDRSKHLISQKAVTSISSIGGGGGGVTAALQSGVLKFFDTFHYDRIGISCQLRDEVCLMNGVEPARTGYYMVKGKGIPRIDIIGNAGRVDWPQLVAQIGAGMHTQNIIVR